MPLMWPALVTTGLLAFITAWNEFLFALTFTSSDAQTNRAGCHRPAFGRQPVRNPLGATSWRHPSSSRYRVVVLVLIFQRRIISGLTAGGVKGLKKARYGTISTR